MATERIDARPGEHLALEHQLHKFEALTDAALAYLDTNDLLIELLDRLRETLKVDTAAVLMMDESESYLVATAARGIEEEARQGVRIPIGQGFAGRIASERSPHTIEQVDAHNVLSPALRNKGITSLMGVPLVSLGVVIGVLHVGTLKTRRFTDEDVELLQAVGDQMALAIQARSSIAERAAVVALQRSLMPASLPQVPGLSAAARYIPAEGRALGGDWYDLFTLPNGQVCVAIGDVVGHGLRAAVVMGRLRSALRAYAFDGFSPDEVLSRLHRKLQHFEPGEMATLLYVTFDPSLEHVALSSAGHLPPLLATSDGATSSYVDVPPDPPLGVAPDNLTSRRTMTIRVPPGGVLCMYTDGLIERRHEPLDDGLARLRSHFVADDPDEVCSSLMSALVGSEDPRDDIAVIALRREIPRDRNAIVVPAEPASLSVIRLAMRRWLAGAGAGNEDTDDLVVAVGEAAANAVKHAYGAQRGTVEINLDLTSGEAVATIRDTGTWRRRRARAGSLGRGILLMERCSDDLRIAQSPAGTEVTIRRKLREGTPA
jgi:serine phosphatase RsbU (regulator of sigma subunit)/anti-sigma regulatory factor (Ser/Thr protein kinase)